MTDKTCLSKGWVDNTTTAVLYPTDVKTHVLNIDSRFRDHSQSVSSTDFMIKLPRTYKNVIGVRLSSVEIPNTWYTFTCARGNTAIKVNNIVSYIPDGNYTPTQLAASAESAIQTAAGDANTTVAFSSVTGKITISNSTDGLSLEFGTAPSCGDCLSAASSLIPYNGGLGYQLGFTGTAYGGNSTFTGEYIVDTMRDTYVLLQLPELETKIAIVEKKSELNGIHLSKEIINYIATSLDSSIREIEGLLIKINASADLLGQKIDMDLVKNLLKDQIKEKKNNIKLPNIIEVIASELNIKPGDLKSSKRTANIVNARRIVIYLARELTHNSMPDIAKFLGMKDHSSVSKNISKANELIEKDENFRLNLENLKNKILTK